MQNKNNSKIHRAKKSLGQNFLKSVPALNKIIEAGEVSANDTVLEIGPGKGALTERLLACSFRLIAVEKDNFLYEELKIKYQKQIAEGKLILINGDILEFKPESHKLAAKSYKLIANIPYNITGAILKQFLTAKAQPERMVLMVQNEVAKRIVARDGKESILSISIKAYGVPKLVMKVPARYFSPAPKVDSAIISITNISKRIFSNKNTNERAFWEIVKAGFAHKRKKLSGNLKGIITKEKLEELSIENKRAEDLKLADWIKLTNTQA